MNAHVGETVALAVNLSGSSKDKVTFQIRLGADLLATVDGTTKDGTATATWKVDVGGHALPADVTFTAQAAGKAVSSGTLQVVPADPVVGPLGPTGATSGAFQLANGVLVIDIGTQLPMTTTLTTASPAELEVFVDDVPADASQPGKPIGAAIFHQAGISGTGQPVVVTIPWDVQPVGAPLVRLRADVKLDGKVVEQRRSNLIVLTDWVDVTLKDPPAIDAAQQGKEGRERHVFLSGQPVPEVPEPPPGLAPPPVAAQRLPAWAHDALVVELDGVVPEQGAIQPDEHGVARVRFAHGTQARAIAIRAEQTAYGVAWHDAGASSVGEAIHRVVQPRTQVELAVTARRRLSLWLAPNDIFGWPSQVGGPGLPGTWSAQDRWDKLRDHVDDVVLLNLFTPVLAANPDDIELRYVGIPSLADTTTRSTSPAKVKAAAAAARARIDRLADLRRIIDACHTAGTQVLLGHGGIIGKISESPWLAFLQDTEDLTDAQIAAQATRVVAQVIDTDQLAVDGFDFDLEHLTTSSVWSMALRQRVRSWFRALAVELRARKKLLGIASASFISHADVADRTPATGSASGQTFTLAIECPNILMRPMCYDNGFLDAQLLDFQRRVVRFALADAPAGAGIHPAQFQIGVKTFKGTNNSEEPTVPGDDKGNQHRLKGWYRTMPGDLLTICKDTLAPSRVGVILFGPRFDDLAAIDAALNPLPGDRKQINTPGTPLHGALPK